MFLDLYQYRVLHRYNLLFKTSQSTQGLPAIMRGPTIGQSSEITASSMLTSATAPSNTTYGQMRPEHPANRETHALQQ